QIRIARQIGVPLKEQIVEDFRIVLMAIDPAFVEFFTLYLSPVITDAINIQRTLMALVVEVVPVFGTGADTAPAHVIDKAVQHAVGAGFIDGRVRPTGHLHPVNVSISQPNESAKPRIIPELDEPRGTAIKAA